MLCPRMRPEYRNVLFWPDPCKHACVQAGQPDVAPGGQGFRSRNYPSKEYTMKHLRMIGLTLAAALLGSAADAEELTGTLKNIKETGAITIGFRDSSIPFSYFD